MTDDLARTDLGGWPFWAPSEGRAVARALRLAGVGPGDRFVDLGCGDGRVLVAAAQRGALVTGVESDSELAEIARRTLEVASVPGTVVEGDVFHADVDATVVFTYLSPATLQRLRARLAALGDGVRIVTVDFAIPGWVPDRTVGGVRLYRLPASPAPRATPGWPAAGTLVAPLADCQSLTSLEFVARGGPVDVRLSASLSPLASIQVGADGSEPGEAVAVDIRWHELPAGTLVDGEIDAIGAGRHFVAGVVGGEGDHWDLTVDGCESVRRRLRDREPVVSTDDLVAATDV